MGKVACAMHYISIPCAGDILPGTELTEKALGVLTEAQRKRLFAMGALRMVEPMILSGKAQTSADLTEPTDGETEPTGGEQTEGLLTRSCASSEDEEQPTRREAARPTSGEQTEGLPSRSCTSSDDEEQPTPEEVAAFLNGVSEVKGEGE